MQTRIAMRHATLVELGRESTQRFANRPLFGERRGTTWQWMTYADWQGHIDALRSGLAQLGVAPGERVAIVSRNSAAWATAAYATYGLGAAFVPMYEAQRPQDWEFILRDCEATIVFGRTPEIVAALEAMRSRLPALRHVVQIEDDAATSETSETVATLEARGRAAPIPERPVASEDIAGLIYTSGTTGFPKGAMLTHANLTSNIDATLAEFPLSPTDRTLSFLPWAHVYGQACELHMGVTAGASTAFNVSTEHLIEDLAEVRPTILVAVPRIFNRIYAGLDAQMAERPKAVRFVFEHGLAASIRRRRGEQLGISAWIWYALASVLFAVIRRKFGGRLRYAISASATLSRKVAEMIDGLGIDVYEGYGMTETSPVIAMNRPGHRKLGTVGLPLSNVRVEIDQTRGSTPGEGEIIVYGPNVMKGYHARPDENARAFTADGGLRTGDLGRFDADGYLAITGRIKEQYKLENGKYVMPGPLEEKLALSPYIRNVMLYGDGKPYNVALVSIDSDRVRGWAQDSAVSLAADLTRDPRVRSLIQSELDRTGAELRAYERPRACTLTEQAFTVENGLLTPTLKLKRRDVVAMFGSALEALYGGALGTVAAPTPSSRAPLAT
jgi:long-chain acyl-CoA synthetase